MLSIAGFVAFVSCVPAMLDFTLREFALFAAIVFLFCSWLIDHQVLYALLESLSSY
jgi:hypothetical protein